MHVEPYMSWSNNRRIIYVLLELCKPLAWQITSQTCASIWWGSSGLGISRFDQILAKIQSSCNFWWESWNYLSLSIADFLKMIQGRQNFCNDFQIVGTPFVFHCKKRKATLCFQFRIVIFKFPGKVDSFLLKISRNSWFLPPSLDHHPNPSSKQKITFMWRSISFF